MRYSLAAKPPSWKNCLDLQQRHNVTTGGSGQTPMVFAHGFKPVWQSWFFSADGFAVPGLCLISTPGYDEPETLRCEITSGVPRALTSDRSGNMRGAMATRPLDAVAVHFSSIRLVTRAYDEDEVDTLCQAGSCMSA
jgi:hypothetical protein